MCEGSSRVKPLNFGYCPCPVHPLTPRGQWEAREGSGNPVRAPTLIAARLSWGERTSLLPLPPSRCSTLCSGPSFASIHSVHTPHHHRPTPSFSPSEAAISTGSTARQARGQYSALLAVDDPPFPRETPPETRPAPLSSRFPENLSHSLARPPTALRPSFSRPFLAQKSSVASYLSCGIGWVWPLSRLRKHICIVVPAKPLIGTSSGQTHWVKGNHCLTPDDSQVDPSLLKERASLSATGRLTWFL